MHYGQELILDLHHCDTALFTREHIEAFFVQLCELIDMDRENLYWWDYDGCPDEYDKAPIHLKGITAVQFISTSNIIIHTLDDLGRIYINLFSCKPYDAKVVKALSVSAFGGTIVSSTMIERL